MIRSKNMDENTTLDQEFIRIVYAIEKNFVNFPKHQKIRIEQWTKKLCQVTSNVVWKRNRNFYAKYLLEMIMNRNLEEPFTKVPNDGPLPKLNKFEMNKKTVKVDHYLDMKEEDPNLDDLLFKNRTNRSSEKKELPQFSSPKESNVYSERKSENFSNEKLEKDLENYKISLDNMPTGKSVDIREYLKLKAELDISKFNEKQLESEINIRINQASQMLYKFDNLNKEYLDARETNLSLLGIFKNVTKFLQKHEDYLMQDPEFENLMGNLVSASSNIKELNNLANMNNNKSNPKLNLIDKDSKEFINLLNKHEKKTVNKYYKLLIGTNK